MIVNGSFIEMCDGKWLQVERLQVRDRVLNYPSGMAALVEKAGGRRLTNLHVRGLWDHWPYEVFPEMGDYNKIPLHDDPSSTRVSPKTRIMFGERLSRDRVVLNEGTSASLETRGKSRLCEDLEAFSYHFVTLERSATFIKVGNVLVGRDSWDPASIPQ